MMPGAVGSDTSKFIFVSFESRAMPGMPVGPAVLDR
jgi:hypothetical protein